MRHVPALLTLALLVAGATLTFASGTSVTASASGAWQLQGTGTSANQAVTIAAPGHMTRETTVRWDSGGRSDVRLDLIAERAPFSLEFFRQFARNAHEEPEALRALRRWIRTPNFYIDTRNPKTGGVLLPSEIGDIERAIREAVPQLTGGQFSAGVIEVAAAPFSNRADFIEVVIVDDVDNGSCADALVGVNPGRIRIDYGECRSSCGEFAPEVVAHEVGHAMGYWHTAARGIMHATAVLACDNLRFSDDERFHARVAYSRPPGNMDVDRDPTTFLAVENGTPPRIFCRHGAAR
jgi:hypothetical protein